MQLQTWIKHDTVIIINILSTSVCITWLCSTCYLKIQYVDKHFTQKSRLNSSETG